MAIPAVVSAEWLKGRLDEGAKVRVLDATYSRERDCNESYKQSHIPGALYFNFMRDVTGTPEIPLNIPSPEVFEAHARGVGVDADTHVVVYDNSGDGGYNFGSRVWWQFRLFGHTKVSVLDGAMHAWVQCGFPTTNREEKVVPNGNYCANFQVPLIRNYDDMVRNLTDRKWPVLDCRTSTLYKGNPEDKQSGHYPGAISLPVATKLVDVEHSRLKDEAGLRKAFHECGVSIHEPFVSMCTSGRGACLASLVAYMFGHPEVPIYLGSFNEWKRRSPPEYIEKSQT